jgi:hypothetical protein
MADTETIAATIAAALLQPMRNVDQKQPANMEDVIAAARHAVTLYETILGMLSVQKD